MEVLDTLRAQRESAHADYVRAERVLHACDTAIAAFEQALDGSAPMKVWVPPSRAQRAQMPVGRPPRQRISRDDEWKARVLAELKTGPKPTTTFAMIFVAKSHGKQ